MLESGLWPHLLTVAGFLLAFFLVARLMSEKKAPANTVSWLLIIILVPYVGVPLYLIFGGRKLQRLAKRKARLIASLPDLLATHAARDGGPVAHTASSSGACPPVTGNRICCLTTGEEEFAELERRIRAARHSIHIATFILARDDVGRRVVALLAERAREGVRVYLLLDALGSMLSSRAFVNPLRRAGGKVARFMPVLPFASPGTANLRNHRKMAVFDNAVAIVGGRNIAREYMGPAPFRKRWHDFGAVIEGPAAALLNEVFIADWSFATGQKPNAVHGDVPLHGVPSAGASELQVVASGPDVEGDPLYEGILAMIQEAKHDIVIVTPYFIPDDVLLRSLIVKVRAGGKVTLIVPARSNHPVTDFARRHYTRELRRAGASVLLYGGAMLHAKAVIVDDRVALFGSPNFDLRSLFVNFEVGVLVHSRDDVRAMRAWADDLARHCHSSRPESARSGVLQGIAEDVSRLLAPLL
jgi:cardiolipin synthase